MDFAAFLSHSDGERALRTIDKLRGHDISPLVLAGGFAFELHLLKHGLPSIQCPLNDIDFLLNSFDEIPKTLSADFVFRHVHPHDPPGKTLLQSIDPETAVRVDIFRAYGNEMARAQATELAGDLQLMISLEDLIARTARLCLDLAAGTPTPAKHTRDFLRLLPLADAKGTESIWREHRKPNHPDSFAEAAKLLAKLIPLSKDLQIAPRYSCNVDEICLRCQSTPHFPLAGCERVLSLLGYC